MEQSAQVVVAEQLQRRPVLGVDPKLILVVETNRPIPETDFRPADLRVLDASSREIVVAFASDPRLTAFLARVGRYSEGTGEDRATAAFEGFFDAVVRIRRYGPQDRLTERAQTLLETADPADEVTVDLECWYPGSAEGATAWLDEIQQATEAGGGRVSDRYLNAGAGIALVRVQAPRRTVELLAELDAVATIDAPPEPALWWSEAANLGLSDVPSFDPPDAEAPLVAVIDSGVRSAHPLLAGAVHDALPAAGLPSGEDQHGHGTAVASLVLHGELEAALARGFLPRPPLRLLSIRVLNHNNEFSLGTLWAHELEEAVRLAAQEGARIVNVSIGDASTPFRGPRSTPVAAVLDQLARELNLVIVVSAGNVALPDYLTVPSRDHAVTYTAELISNDSTGILDPAPAALALTVGALVSKAHTGSLRRKAFGDVSWPSPFTRTGPGIGGAVKPELVAPGGSVAIDLSTEDLIEVGDLACLGADGSGLPGALISANVGTSFAAPLVSRVAAGVVAEYPGFDSNLVRALVLQSAEEPEPHFPLNDDGVGQRGRSTLRRQLVGFGQPLMDNAIRSKAHRAVLVASDAIELDGVHLYEIPVPDSFFDSGGERGITVALSYSPETRGRRLDYLSSRMKFELVRGLEADEVVALFLAAPEDFNEGNNHADDSNDADGADAIGEAGPRTRLSDLRRTERPPMEPSTRVRSAGSNQVGRLVFRQALRREDGESFLLLVQNTNRWGIAGTTEPYGLAVAVWRSEGQAEVYAELEAELEAQARVLVEAEIETGS